MGRCKMKKNYFFDRLMSLFYDYLFVIITMGVIAFGLYYLDKNVMEIPYFYIVLVIIEVFFYFIIYPLICLKLKGSLGKSLNDLYIEPTLGRITYGRILFREVFLKQLFYLTIIGIIVEIIFYLSKKQTLHDYYLKTKVLKKEPEEEEKPKRRLFRKNK